MNKACLRNYLIVSGTLLVLFCAPGIEVSQIKAIPTAASPFYQNVPGSINYYAVSFDGKEPLNQLNPVNFGMGKECYFEFLDNGWFLNWKSDRGALTECRRGVWAIEDSTLILLNLQRSKLETMNLCQERNDYGRSPDGSGLRRALAIASRSFLPCGEDT